MEQPTKKEKIPLTAEQLYKRNKQRAKVLTFMSPIVFWIFIALTILFFFLAIRNSVGNITEILHLLDKDAYTGAEIEEHYAALIERWGEWEIVNGDGAGIVIRFVDIRNALFSGLMVTYTVLMFLSLSLAVGLGKIVLPQLAKVFSNNNDELVDVATLKSAQQIDEMTKKNKKEWF